MKYRLLDLFCGAGGAAMGYHRAGFEVVGVDIKPQPHYPFEFHQADALEYCAEHGCEFDVIHASPPCQAYSVLNVLWDRDYPEYINDSRMILKESGKYYVIENVVGAPLFNYVMLCGTMFGLRVQRHRLFECNPSIYFAPKTCNHYFKTNGTMKNYQTMAWIEAGNGCTIVGHSFDLVAGSYAMGINWMTKDELAEAIPPAYTEFIGKQLMRILA